MKVALVHDDLVQWGGAERVLLAIAELFPDAPIFTSLFDDSNQILSGFLRDKKIITSFMQRIPGWRGFYKALLPLYPLAFEQFDFSNFDLVISHTTRFAKAIITKPSTKHICYCHTPPRFLWNLSGEKVLKILEPYLSFLRLYDQIISRRVDYWVAGSKNCRSRIKRIYRADSSLLYPFVNFDFLKNQESFWGEYYLTIARLNHYKRVDLAVEAFKDIPSRLKIVGIGPEASKLQARASDNIEFLGSVTEEMLGSLLAGCKALVVTAEEDFGLTALEAQALGKPVIAFGRGGALETVIDNQTGVLFNEQSVASLKEAIKVSDNLAISPDSCINNAEKFSKKEFQKKFLEIINNLAVV